MFLRSMHTGQPHRVSAWFSRLAAVSGVLLFQLVLPRMCLTSQPTCNQTNITHQSAFKCKGMFFKLVETSRNLKCPKVKRSFSFFHNSFFILQEGAKIIIIIVFCTFN